MLFGFDIKNNLFCVYENWDGIWKRNVIFGKKLFEFYISKIYLKFLSTQQWLNYKLIFFYVPLFLLFIWIFIIRFHILLTKNNISISSNSILLFYVVAISTSRENKLGTKYVTKNVFNIRS